MKQKNYKLNDYFYYINELSIKYGISSNALNDINKLLQRKYDTSQNIKLRNHTPKQLVKYGVKDLPMLMNCDHILSNISSENEAMELNLYNKDANYHELGVKKFLEVINGLDIPEAIYKNKNNKDFIILTNQKNNYNEDIIVPIYIETRGNYNYTEINTNKIKSVYGKKKLNNYIRRKIIKNQFKEIYKKNQVYTTGSQSSNDINLNV